MLFYKIKPRRFTFTPYYYEPKEEDEEQEQHPRIRFRHIRRKTRLRKKPIVHLAILAILLLLGLIYFWRLVEEDNRTFKIEDIEIVQ